MTTWKVSEAPPADGEAVLSRAAPIAGIGEANYRGKHGYPVRVDGHVRDFSADILAGIVIPGGWAPDKRNALVEAVKVEDIRRAARRFLAEVKLLIMLVGQPEQKKPLRGG